MSRSPLDFLRHMLDETIYLMEQTQGLTQDDFRHNATLQRAFVRSIEIIGEAARQTPEDFRQTHSRIEWRAMAGMRDRLIHGYFGVDYDLVWDVVTQKVPALRQTIEEILETEEDQSAEN